MQRPKGPTPRPGLRPEAGALRGSAAVQNKRFTTSTVFCRCNGLKGLKGLKHAVRRPLAATKQGRCWMWDMGSEKVESPIATGRILTLSPGEAFSLLQQALPCPRLQPVGSGPCLGAQRASARLLGLASALSRQRYQDAPIATPITIPIPISRVGFFVQNPKPKIPNRYVHGGLA